MTLNKPKSLLHRMSGLGCLSRIVKTFRSYQKSLYLTAGLLLAIWIVVAPTVNAQEDLKLTPADGAAGDVFGRRVAVDDGIALVAAFGDDDTGINSDSAYVFDVEEGVELLKLTPGDGAARDLFGFPVALDDGIALIGASNDDDNGSNSGSAYVFDVEEAEDDDDDGD